MPLPKKYHAVTFMSILVMLLLLGLYLLSGGYTSAESQLAESRAAALARANSTTQHLQLPSSSNNIFSSQQQHQQAPPAYRHPIVYDKLTGATNNQINEVLGAVKPPGLVLADYPIDHYQQQQQQPPPQGFYHHPPGGPNLLADAQQQQRHRQQMLDRQMLFGPSSPFGSASPLLPPPPPPPPATTLDFPSNQTDGYNPNAALYRQQQPPLMPTQFSMPPLPPPPPPPSQRDQQQQQQQPAPSNQAPPIRPPYAHLAPSNMPPAQPLSQYEQQQQQQTQLKPAAQSRIIPLNSRIDPTSATPPSQLLLSPPQQQQQQQQQQQPQMVLASNQAPPPRSSNSVAPPPPPLSINNNVGANRLTAPPAPLCVRQQIDQQHQQQVPAAAEATNASTTTKLQMPVLFCNLDPEYPTKEIMRALEIYAREQRSIEQLMPQLLVQLHIQAQPARQPGGNHQLITLDQLQYALQPASSAGQAWQNNSSEQQQPPPLTQFPSANFEQMCRSTIQMAQPRRAKNLAGQWKVVVNLPGHKYRGIAISQMVRVEECSSPLGECATPAKPSIGLAKSTCLQHYENQRLIAWSPQQGLHVDMFRMPVACSCHIRRS